MIENVQEKEFLTFGQHVAYYTAIANINKTPDQIYPEVCFAGRSNVGKSSLINAICKRRNIARTSTTPGRTQLIHLYLINNKLFISDLPGYGYAKASKSKIFDWNKLIKQYLENRSIQRIFLLIDARRGIKENDLDMMFFLDKIGLNFQCTLTKIDKVKGIELKKTIHQIEKEIKNHGAAYPEIISTSVKKNIGIEEIRGHLNLLYKHYNTFEEKIDES